MAKRATSADLQSRIMLQTRADTQDDHGQDVAAWADLMQVWAKAEPKPVAAR